MHLAVGLAESIPEQVLLHAHIRVRNEKNLTCADRAPARSPRLPSSASLLVRLLERKVQHALLDVVRAATRVTVMCHPATELGAAPRLRVAISNTRAARAVRAQRRGGLGKEEQGESG